MNKATFGAVFLLGLSVVIWMGMNFVGSDTLALSMIVLIGLVYSAGFFELVAYRRNTATLDIALDDLTTSPVQELTPWVSRLHPSLQHPVRARIEGERVGLPLPVFTPYLVGLLVMLGLLGTFAGLVGTLKGAVLALEATTELQAIRDGLAAPMKGLGLAFGTSVAGVAASAVLGLLSTLVRRERLASVRVLDQKISTVLQPFSLNFHRQLTYEALQQQSEVLPNVAERLEQVATQMTQMGERMSENITAQQSALREESLDLFRSFASSVESSLSSSLSESAKLTGEQISPLLGEVVSNMESQISDLASTTQAQLSASLSQQLAATSEQVTALTKDVEASWREGLAAHTQSNQAALTAMQSDLQAAQRDMSVAMTGVVETLQDKQSALTEQLGAQWTSQQQGLQQSSDALLSQLSTAAERNLSQQQQASEALLAQVNTLAGESEALLKARMEGESTWLTQQDERIQTMTTGIKDALAGLRDEEAERAGRAVEQLAQLEAKVSEHLTTLGQGLEAPMQELIAAASEAPKAAADAITELRREMAKGVERENHLMQERADVVASLQGLFETMEQASQAQHETLNACVTEAAKTFAQLSSGLSEKTTQQLDEMAQASHQMATSALDMASVGDAFTTAIEQFDKSNTELLTHLGRAETALIHSADRSDEQLAYYVAQAKEMIDHSLLSQQELFQKLRQLAQNSIAMAE